MREESSGAAVSVAAWHDGVPKSSLDLAPSSASAVTSSAPACSSTVAVPAPAPAPGRMLEEYSGVVSVTVYTEVFDGGEDNPPSSVPSPSSMPAPGWVPEESSGAVSVTADSEACHGSGNNPPSPAPRPSSMPAPVPALVWMPEESSGAVSLTAYTEACHDSGNNRSSTAPLPSSMPALAPALGQMLEESSDAVSLTAYIKACYHSGNNLSSLAVPPLSVQAPVLASGQMFEERNGVVPVTAYPEAYHHSGNNPSSYPEVCHGAGKKKSSPPSSDAPPQALDWMLDGRGAVSATAYPQVGHGNGKKKSSSPPSAATEAPASGRTIEDYAMEWAARKAAAGAPSHQCVLPFLTGAPKAVECRVCYRIIHPLEEIKCSVSRCEQSFHLACAMEYTANFTTESFKCPQHGCMVCKQKMFFWRCGRCTVAAHTKCAPWPVIHLKDDQGSSICWRHPANWLLQNENADLTNNIEEAFCRLPLPYVNEEFNIDSTIQDFTAIVCKPPSYTHIKRNVYLVKKKRADSSAETGCRNCRADSVCRDDCECRGLSMSCSKSCRCSDLCSNRPFRKDKKFKIVKSEGCGWGAVALEPLEKGDFIIEYVGEVINDATCEQRLWEMKRRGDKNFYMQVDGETRVGVFASRSIEVGEPLTYDYRFVHFGEKVKCHCGAKTCQGFLGIQLKNPARDALAAVAALENQLGGCSPSRLKPETHLLPWTNCIEVPFNLRSKTKIDKICWGRKRQRTSIIDPSPSSVMEAAAPIP
ncbi:unnamed protein product [Alopecurus aequalis]